MKSGRWVGVCLSLFLFAWSPPRSGRTGQERTFLGAEACRTNQVGSTEQATYKTLRGQGQTQRQRRLAGSRR
jgi:hypothetical protein